VICEEFYTLTEHRIFQNVERKSFAKFFILKNLYFLYLVLYRLWSSDCSQEVRLFEKVNFRSFEVKQDFYQQQRLNNLFTALERKLEIMILTPSFFRWRWIYPLFWGWLFGEQVLGNGGLLQLIYVTAGRNDGTHSSLHSLGVEPLARFFSKGSTRTGQCLCLLQYILAHFSFQHGYLFFERCYLLHRSIHLARTTFLQWSQTLHETFKIWGLLRVFKGFCPYLFTLIYILILTSFSAVFALIPKAWRTRLQCGVYFY